jgi:hypothetical protein
MHSLYKLQVLLVKAVPADKSYGDSRDTYTCPVYATEARFREEVFAVSLKSKGPSLKWTIAGVCMFLDVMEVS